MDKFKDGWGKFCEKYLITQDYHETLMTNAVQKITAEVANEDLRIELLVDQYRKLGNLRMRAAEKLGKDRQDHVLLAEDSFIWGVAMSEIGNELRRIMLSQNESLGDPRFEEIWEAFEDYLVFERRCVVIKVRSSQSYKFLEVDDF